MILRDYLRVPYIVAASSEDRGDGTWVRIAECPELPACRVAAASMVDAMSLIARERIEAIVRELVRGTPPPVPRPPLDSIDPEEELGSLGLMDDFGVLLDLTEKQLEGRMIEG